MILRLWRGSWTTAFCFAGASLWASAGATIVAGEVAEAHERLRHDASFQFEFTSSPPPSPPPNWVLRITEFLESVARFMAPFIEVVFWVGVVLMGAGAVYFIGREILWRLRRDGAAGDEDDRPSYRPTPSFVRTLLEDADRLAAKGRYGDAVRVLLFRSIEDIHLFQPNHLRIAMTSREISRLAILPTAARTAFSKITAAVERSRFAGREIDSVVFADCRAAYGVFADTEVWR